MVPVPSLPVLPEVVPVAALPPVPPAAPAPASPPVALAAKAGDAARVIAKAAARNQVGVIESCISLNSPIKEFDQRWEGQLVPLWKSCRGIRILRRRGPSISSHDTTAGNERTDRPAKRGGSTRPAVATCIQGRSMRCDRPLAATADSSISYDFRRIRHAQRHDH